MDGRATTTAARERWRQQFDERYGGEAFTRLMALFEQPCVTFAGIAGQFGVTRERVRQWHLELLPDAPRGHERQHLCLIQNQKRRLLADPLFRSFSRHARTHLSERRFVLIPARDGFRKRSVRLDGRVIGLRQATPRRRALSGTDEPAIYNLAGPGADLDFLYYQLADDSYLVVPAEEIPAAGTTFVDAGTSRFARFRNTFAAVLEGRGARIGFGANAPHDVRQASRIPA